MLARLLPSSLSFGMTLEVTLYTRRNCSLCDKAKAAMLASGVPLRINEIDIDADASLRASYTNDVPVITFENQEVFRHRIDAKEFAERIRKMTLASEKCVPCRGGVPALKGEALASVARELGGSWRVVDGHHLEKSFPFPDFASALAFTNKVGALAEEEGHHPDIHLAWGNVRITIWTHKIDGLTRSDFVLAAKIDRL
jgi:4a-hydroxytetrahydrobiopterin dehydratase